MSRLAAIALLPTLVVVLSLLSEPPRGGSTGSLTDARKHEAQAQHRHARVASEGAQLLADIASPFVPNLGQWEHPAKFVQRGGSMTVFVEGTGWVLDLREPPKYRAAEPRRGFDALEHGLPVNTEQTLRGVAVRTPRVRGELAFRRAETLPYTLGYPFGGGGESGSSM